MTYGTEPGHWFYETTGVLRPAVEAYLAGSMSPIQIAAMRAYLRQWIDAPAWTQDPQALALDRKWLKSMRSRVGELYSIEAIRAWLVEAIDNGIDPL